MTTKTQNKTAPRELFIKTPTGAQIANLTKEQKTALDKMDTKSAKIRYLAAEGYSTKDNMFSGIANLLQIRTQHVRNVLTQPLKRKAQ